MAGVEGEAIFRPGTSPFSSVHGGSDGKTVVLHVEAKDEKESNDEAEDAAEKIVLPWRFVFLLSVASFEGMGVVQAWADPDDGKNKGEATPPPAQDSRSPCPFFSLASVVSAEAGTGGSGARLRRLLDARSSSAVVSRIRFSLRRTGREDVVDEPASGKE